MADSLAPTADASRADAGAPRAEDVASRVRAGANPATAPDMLRALAADPQVTVRAAVAMNPAAPWDADSMLRGDEDVRVRALLASRLAKLIPSLPTHQRQQLREQALTTLGVLVEDEAERVRRAIADAVKDMPDAPRDLILRLARDSAPNVCGPVIRLSPLLTAEDLLLLLSTADSAATVSSVASRPGLAEAVSDAIAATADTSAIRALLMNRTAAIREATLDALVNRAEKIVSWHAPLVRRPLLSATAAHALSDFVATDLLNEMTTRGDLPPGVTETLRRRLTARLMADTPMPPEIDSKQALVEARRIQAENQLNEDTILAAIRRGESRMATALLAVAANVAIQVVERAITLRSAKALVALVWRCGFTMRLAVPLQTLLCRLPPSELLRANISGDFPMGAEEMRWQIDFVSQLGR